METADSTAAPGPSNCMEKRSGSTRSEYVPEGVVSPEDKLKDQTVRKIIGHARELSAQVSRFLDKALLTERGSLYLSTSAAVAGDRINITRLGNDPYARLVHGASIKVLTAGTWGRVGVFDGEAWLLRASAISERHRWADFTVRQGTDWIAPSSSESPRRGGRSTTTT